MGVGYNPKIVTNGLVLALDAGNTKSFPLAPSYSNYFDGNGDNLTTASSSAFNFGTGDFTVEAWFYPTALGRQHSLVDLRSTGTNGWVFYINSSNRLQYWDGSSTTSSTSTVSINTWSHLVWCRSGSTLKAFLNGVEAFSTTNSRNNNTDVPACIGSSFDTQAYSLGYLSNVRVVKGTALYTANFTVPTAPLTAITNTSLLTCQSATLIDNSTNNFTLTRNGDVSVQTLSPFTGNFPTGTTWRDLSGNGNNGTLTNDPTYSSSNGGSLVFDGSNDFVSGSISTLSDWSISLWYLSTDITSKLVFYPFSGTATATGLGFGGTFDANTNNRWYFFDGTNTISSSSTAITTNVWYNLVVTKSSTSYNLYTNGSLSLSSSGSNISLTQYNLGRRGDNNWHSKGNIAQASLYNRALTAPEVLQNFNALRGRFGI